MQNVKNCISRVGAIVENTVREALRMRLFLFLALSGMASLAAGLYFQEFNLGTSELRFIADFGFGAMTLLGSIMAVVVTVQLVYGEIDRRTLMPLLAKPVTRGEILVGKLIGAWLTISSFVAIITVSLIAALMVRESQLSALYQDSATVDYGNIVIFAGLQCLRLIILASFSAFFATYATSSLFAIFMSFSLWIIGQIHAIVYEQLSRSSGFGWDFLLRLITLAVPDLRLFDLGSDVIEGQQIGAGTVFQLFAYAAVYALLYSGLALLALRNREL